MKYIRTKDERILRVPFTKQEYDTSFPNTAVSYDEWFELWKYDMQILKQADTIEELCDEFVRIISNNRHDTIDLELAKQYKIAYPNIKVFGAIWTDKGLQFVTRMNSEGVLELL